MEAPLKINDYDLRQLLYTVFTAGCNHGFNTKDDFEMDVYGTFQNLINSKLLSNKRNVSYDIKADVEKLDNRLKT